MEITERMKEMRDMRVWLRSIERLEEVKETNKQLKERNTILEEKWK